MDRINGYRIIDDYKYLTQTEGNRHTVLKLTDGKIDHFFKMVDLAERYKELFFSMLLNERGVDTVQIDFAKYNGQFGIVSPSYNLNKEVKPLSEIIEQYKNLEMYENKKVFNVKTVNEILYLFSIQEKCAHTSLQKELFFKFIMQILLGNSDLNSNNIEIIIGNRLTLSPFYGFENCGVIDLKETSFYNGYMFGYNQNAEDFESAATTIKKLLQIGSKTEIETFKDWLEHMKAANTNKIIKMSEEKIEKRIPKDIKLQLVREYKTNLQNVDSIVKGK